MTALRTRSLGGGRPGHHRAKVFVDGFDVACAICDRLLSAPESQAWALHLPSLGPILAEDAVCRAFAVSLFETEGASGAELYREWVEFLGRGAQRGYRLGWWWSAGGENVYVTPEGALVILDGDSVQDALIPGSRVTFLRSRRPADESLEMATARRRRDPLPLTRCDPIAVHAPYDRYTVFRHAAAEIQALYAHRVATLGSSLQSPRFEARFDVRDPITWNLAFEKSEGPR